MQKIDLKFSVEECNLLLEALGKMPYEKAFSLVASLQQQAAAQLNEANKPQEDSSVDDGAD